MDAVTLRQDCCPMVRLGSGYITAERDGYFCQRGSEADPATDQRQRIQRARSSTRSANRYTKRNPIMLSRSSRRTISMRANGCKSRQPARLKTSALPHHRKTPVPSAFLPNAASGSLCGVSSDSPGTFEDSGLSLGDSFSQDVVLGDVDGDGDLDAFVANDGPNQVWLNQGGLQSGTPGTFSDSGQTLGYRPTFGVALGDVDGDGDLDAFVTNGGYNSDLVWLNQGGAQSGSPGTFQEGQSLGFHDTRDVSLEIWMVMATWMPSSPPRPRTWCGGMTAAILSRPSHWASPIVEPSHWVTWTAMATWMPSSSITFRSTEFG